MGFFEKFVITLNGAIRRRQVSVEVSFSKQTFICLSILRNLGYVNGFIRNNNSIIILLKYVEKRPVLKQISLISKAGRKAFTSVVGLKYFISKIQKNCNEKQNQFFAVILSTNKGLLTHHQALKYFIGGQPLCVVYT
jgi:small subunit ribosomal protein S8